jgi:uncharacterized protein (TIGR01244 family)
MLGAGKPAGAHTRTPNEWRILMTAHRTVALAAALLCTLPLAAPLHAAEWTELSEGRQASDTVIVGAQPTREVLQQAADAGIKVVVNMRGADEDPGYDEAAAAAELGLTYLQLPIAGAAGLTPENVTLFDALLKQVGDQPTLMHCASGNRVGAMHALHASQYGGMDAEAAIEYGKAHGMTSLEEAVRERLEP